MTACVCVCVCMCVHVHTYHTRSQKCLGSGMASSTESVELRKYMVPYLHVPITFS